MAEIKLIKLRCIRPEDISGDEPKLTIVADGNLQGSIQLGENIQPGEHALIDKTIKFNNKVSITLHDQDVGFPIDPHDFLGEVTIRATDDTSDGRFTGDDTSYVLEWEVIPPQPPPEQPETPGNDNGSGTITGNVLQIGLGTHKLPNEGKFCFQHGVDTRSVRLKVWAEARHPTLEAVKAAIRECAIAAAGVSIAATIATEGAGAPFAVAAFKAAFVTCLKAKIGEVLAAQARIELKWKTEKGGWSGH